MRRAAGAPPGAAVHAFRHRYVNEEIRRETLHRLTAGFDTSTTAIATAVSLRVGHTNPESLYQYVAYYQSVDFFREPIQMVTRSMPDS